MALSNSEFDWEAHYGAGFDVINMKLINDGDNAKTEKEEEKGKEKG